MDSLRDIAGRVDEAADSMTRAVRVLADLDPGGAAFGAAAPGRLGEIGRALHTHLASALTARSREAATATSRLADTAQHLRRAADRYAEAEDAAQRRPQEA
jgi:hypothetical protein